jgi:hypothetical protein
MILLRSFGVAANELRVDKYRVPTEGPKLAFA